MDEFVWFITLFVCFLLPDLRTRVCPVEARRGDVWFDFFRGCRVYFSRFLACLGVVTRSFICLFTRFYCFYAWYFPNKNLTPPPPNQHSKRPRTFPRRQWHPSILLQRLPSNPPRNILMALRRMRARGRSKRHVRI